jgi:hypothetical protein
MATQTTKRETVISTEYNRETGVLVFKCPPLGKSREIVIADLAPHIAEDGTVHGIRQKGIDAAAIGRNPDTGASATPQDKWNAVTVVLDRLTHPTDPQWNAPREGGDGSASLLARALMRIKGRDRETIEAWLKTKTDAEKKGLRANPKVIEMMATIQAENADPSIDSDELLDELDD